MARFTYNNNPVLIFFIVIGFLAALIVNWQRHVIEDANSNVEIIMAYDDIANLAREEGVSPETLFPLLKQAGLTSLSIDETTLEKLHKNGKLTVTPGTFLLEQNLAGGAANPLVANHANAQEVYVIAEDKQLFNEVKSDLMRRLSPGRVRVISEDGRMILAVKADYEKLLEYNLGFSVSQLKEAAGYGFYIVPRPVNYTVIDQFAIDTVFERLSAIDKGKISAVVFVEKEALGYPNLLPYVAEKLRDTGFALGLIEHPVQLQFYHQEGLLPMVAALDYKAVRLYSIQKAEQIKITSDEATRRIANSARERNIRLNLLRLFEKPEPGKSLLQTQLDYVSSVKEAILAKGFKLGKAEPFPPYFASRFLLALVAVGISCASALLLGNMFSLRSRWQYITALLLAVILVFPILKGAGTLARQVAALAAICSFPVLAVFYQADYWRRRISVEENMKFAKMAVLGVGGLAAATFASLAGGLYAGAILSDVRFFLEIEIFRGVKLSFIAPLILITIIYLAKSGEQNGETLWERISRILNYPVFIKTLLLAGIAAFVIFVFLGRSGHTAGVPVPSFELKLRLFLEQVFYARPREKEFLIGHPAFLLFLGALRFNLPKLWQYLLLVAATIGQSSVAETFAHMRTPVYMSAVRGIDGLVLGLIAGIVVLGAFYAFMRLMGSKQKEKGVT